MVTLRVALKDKLSQEEQKILKTSYDMLGNIAILEIDDGLRKKEKAIANTLLEISKQIKTVFRKEAAHEGVFRTQKLKFLAGINTKVAEYRENNVTLQFNVEKIYFSPRLSTERKRIFLQINEGENVLVMFSGCGPYPCVISKNTKAKEIYGVEINPLGHRYAVKNVKLNKMKNIKLFCGDVAEVVPKLNKKFDRILMPLPRSAEDYLECALKASGKNTVIHFYDFLNEEEIPNAAVEKIRKACTKNKMDFQILSCAKCGQFSPRAYRICVDFKIV